MRLVSWEEACRTDPMHRDFHMLNRPSDTVRVERVAAALVPIYQAMTPAQRVVAGLSATDLIRERLHATIRESHREWTDEAVAEAVAERMLGARI